MTISRATPGNTLIQYFPDMRYWEPLAIKRPSDGDVGGRPRQRNDRVASSVMAEATCSAATAISGVRQFGSRCRKMMRGLESPRQVTASMYSLRRSTSAMLRAMRAVWAHCTVISAMMILPRPGPVRASRISAISTGGNDSCMSTSRMMKPSTLPPW